MRQAFLILLLPALLLAGIYHPWGTEAITGGLVFLNENVIDSISESISGDYYVDKGEIYCKFRIEYNISFNAQCKSIEPAVFYYVLAEGVEVSCDDSTISPQYDSLYVDPIHLKLEYLLNKYEDSYKRLFKRQEIYDDSLLWFPVSVTAYPNGTTSLVVNGILKPVRTDIFLVSTAVAARHPFFLNRNSGITIGSFSFILTPLEECHSLSEVSYSFTTPHNVPIASSFFPTSLTNSLPTSKEFFLSDMQGWPFKSGTKNEIYWPLDQPSVEETDFSITYKGSFIEEIPHSIHFVAESRKLEWYPGGPKIGLGSSPSSDKLNMRFGWESALEVRQFNVLLGTDYETDFHGDNRIALSALAASTQSWLIPSVAGGIGIPVDLKHKDVGIRLQYEASIILLGIVGTHDYFPERDEWRFSLYGQISF